MPKTRLCKAFLACVTISVTHIPWQATEDLIDMWNRDFPIAPADYLVLVTVQYDSINSTLRAYALDMTPQQRILLSV
jgi:hypothetical protein